jgi:hypothetical protein
MNTYNSWFNRYFIGKIHVKSQMLSTKNAGFLWCNGFRITIRLMKVDTPFMTTHGNFLDKMQQDSHFVHSNSMTSQFSGHTEIKLPVTGN